MYYRYEARVYENDSAYPSKAFAESVNSWTGIFQCFNPNQRRKWNCLTIPKWYMSNQYTSSQAWFTKHGYQKWHQKMMLTIKDFLEWYPYFEVRILRTDHLENIVMHGKTQCINAIESYDVDTSNMTITHIDIENIDDFL